VRSGKRLPDEYSSALNAMTTRRVTLTFDNGPTPGVTERVLDILGQARLRSTFFVIGKNVGLDD
jgi:peptidoglycan/xylan/chitin deacetylase (PgdA/CDA1 family)